jgi:hypothetical protein
MMNRRFPAQLLFVVVCFAWTGCSGQPGRPETYPVSGTVTYRGKPVADATVTFLAPGAPRLASGETDASGRFRLTTFEPDDGAIPGTHVVAVKKYGDEPRAPIVMDVENMEAEVTAKDIEEAMMQTAEQVKKSAKAGSLLPAKYASRNTSDLRFEVVRGENEFNIDLVD